MGSSRWQLFWEWGSRWRHTEITASPGLAPAGLGPVQTGNEGGTQFPVWIYAGTIPLLVFLGIWLQRQQTVWTVLTGSPAHKWQTFPFFNTHFEGACTSHTRGPSAVSSSTGYSHNPLQECFGICQPVQFWLSVLLQISVRNTNIRS